MLSIVQPAYTFTVTEEQDTFYRKYLARKLRESTHATEPPYHVDATPLDISMDDIEGDVVAGIAAETLGDCLNIDMLWVSQSLRGRGIGQQLVHKAEDIAFERGCTRVRVSTIGAVDFYQKLGYTIAGRLQQFPEGHTVTWLTKTLAEACLNNMAEKDLA